MSYSKSALAGVLAGLLSGVLIGVMYVLLLSQVMVELIDEISNLTASTYGVPYELIHEQLSQIMSIMNVIAPLIYPVQFSLIGALFGLLQHYLMTRLKISLPESVALTGVIYVTLFGIAPLLFIQFTQDPLLTTILEKFGFSIYVYSAMPGVLFTLFLYVLHLVKGPWRKILEARPKEY